MSINLIPDDPLTRKLLARVLAAMIAEDFQQARYGSANCNPAPTIALEEQQMNSDTPDVTKAGRPGTSGASDAPTTKADAQ
jgi:hypothetical protein